jgi:drug/metabolite transporter (DMT)-like permease
LKRADVGELIGLAAIWGASFLLMRLGAGQFGPVALAFVRVCGATLFLLPLLVARGQWPALRAHARPIFLVGITNSALPFLAYSYAALAITAGLSAVFNAATPLFAALIAWVWLRDRLTPSRILGLVIGFAGVLWLVWNKASFKPDASGVSSGWAVVACIAATVCYGWSASFTKRRLQGVPPLAVATGSQLSAAIFLVLPALWFWPKAMPGATSWLAAALLAVVCTGVAYVLYFRLIAHIGPANAVSVTFLIPIFAVVWGYLLLGETVTTAMAIGCLVIVAGTSLAIGMLKPPMRDKG